MDRASTIDRLLRDRDSLLPHFDVSAESLERSYGPGKWTVRQLLAHLADCEFINLYRFCKAVAEPGSSVDGFDEGAWQRELRSEVRDARALGELFRGARGMLIEHARQLSAPTLERSNVHPEKGRMRGVDWIELAIGHVSHHRSQVEAALAGRPWVKPRIENAHRFGA